MSRHTTVTLMYSKCFSSQIALFGQMIQLCFPCVCESCVLLDVSDSVNFTALLSKQFTGLLSIAVSGICLRILPLRNYILPQLHVVCIVITYYATVTVHQTG